jgi:hypothetical protein
MPDQILHENRWLQVRQRDDWYTFVHTPNKVVYILPYRWYTDYRGTQLLARFEICPAHGPDHEQTSITGQCPPGEEPRFIAKQELLEEGGYEADTGLFRSLGVFRPVKFADTCIHLFTIDVTHLKQEKAEGDGSQGEVGSYCRWINREEAINSVCPVFWTMIALAGV